MATNVEIFAKQLLKNAKGKKPAVVELTDAIADVTINTTIEGASSLVLSVIDPQWDILTSDFLAHDKQGRLDAIDVNYPEGSNYWWRLTQVDGSTAKDGANLTLTLEDRVVAKLRNHKGALKANRAHTTRAEFIKHLVEQVAEAKFFAPELHKKQQAKKADIPPPKGDSTNTKTAKDDRKQNKQPGLPDGSDFTIKGVKADASQRKQVERAMTIATRLNAGPLATKAMLCAGIGESNFRAVVNSLGYGGVFQGQVNTGGHYFSVNDTEREAWHFLKGGLGYGGGGAIALAKQGLSPGEIATRVEVSGQPGSFYEHDQHGHDYVKEAERIMELWGNDALGDGSGDSSGTTTKTVIKKYLFRRGKNEDSWAAITRLAEEVKWRAFSDGKTIYYMNDHPDLLNQKPVATIKRTAQSVLNMDFTWDNRRIVTECTLELICGDMEFHAGEVFMLEDFGPANGRWIIQDTTRSIFSESTTFTLTQGVDPLPEPAPETKTVTIGGAGGAVRNAGSGNNAVDAVYAAAHAIGQKNLPYVYGGGHTGSWATARRATGLDCSSSVSLALYGGGLMQGYSQPITSTGFESWGEAGEGEHMTIWTNPDHVWIEFKGYPEKSFNTVPSDGGRSGPHLRSNTMSKAGFIPRHHKDT